MYEYKDPVAAAEWFARTTPEEEAYRQLHNYRGERVGSEWQAIEENLDRAGSDAEALLKEVGLDLIGFGSGVSAILTGLTRRPNAAMRRYDRRGDAATFKYDAYCFVTMDQVTWTWLRPLLVELVERRAQAAALPSDVTAAGKKPGSR